MLLRCQQTRLHFLLCAGAMLAPLSNPAAAQDLPRPVAPGLPQPTADAPPTYQILRQDEDWQAVLAIGRIDVRALPLTAQDAVVVTLGGDLRLRTIYYANGSFGDLPGRGVTLRSRQDLHAAIAFGDRLRLYSEIKSGRVDGKDIGDPVVEDDGPDLHQAFVEVGFGDLLGGNSNDALLRVGRQELHYGSGRLISIREGPGIRADQDGVVLRLRRGGWVVDGFAAWQVTDTKGAFDNRTDRRRPLWGVYGSGPLGPANVDLFYIGFREPTGSYARGLLDEHRHTVGFRLWSREPTTPHAVFDIEADGQFGDYVTPIGARGPIRAWSMSGGLGYAFSTLPWQPRPGIEFGATSGDVGGGTLGTFRAPAPSGQFFGETNPLGPGNLVGFRPLLELHPAKGLSVRPLIEYFWRLRRSDGIYGASSLLLRGVGGTRNFVGHETGVVAAYDLNPHVGLFARFGVFDIGGYLDEHGPSRKITTAEFRLTFRE